MKKVKITPQSQDSYNNDFEMDDMPNNQSKAKDKDNLDGFKMIANIGVAARRWQTYTNSRRRAITRGKSCLDSVDFSTKGRTNDNKPSPTGGSGLAPDLNEEVYGCYQNDPDGTADVIKYQIQTAPNRNLIQYFARLSHSDTYEQYVDLEFVASLVENGADINCTDMYGQTILHEVARTWHVDVAKFLVSEMGADTSQGDRWGRTPLHVAASVDYTDMCDYLVDAGADIEARTEGEQQTPLFYAARNDAVGALKTLIKRGAEFKKVYDYKRRTPLFVAAELDRSETAKMLLELGAPADVRDDSGQPVMVPLIMKMAPVAKEALNQFHQKDRANRKQYYYLGRLDPTTPDEITTKKYQGVMQVIVTNRQYDLAMHNATQRMIQVQWDRFAKIRAFGNLIIQFAYIISWSIFGVAKDWTERYEYKLPDEAWRIVVFAVAVLLTGWQIVEEFMEYRSSNKKHEEWKKWKLQEISRDEAYCHPRWPEEREYLEQEKDDLDSMAPSYFTDPWNIFDWICYLLLLVCIITHLVDIGAHTLLIARWHIRIMAVTIIILWLRFMKVCRAFSLLGPFIVILGHILVDVIKFLFLYLDFYIPFAFAFWMIMGGNDNIPQTHITNSFKKPNVTQVKVSGFDNMGNLLFSMFRLTLVDDYDYDNMIKVDHVMAQILVGAWLALSAILCVNLFIALLSDTFVRVYDNAQANAVMQKAITILTIMDNLSSSRRERFHRFLLEECNPESLYYDDDLSYSGEEDLKRATIEVRENVRDLKERFEAVFGDESEDASPLVDEDGLPMTPRRRSLISTSAVGSLGKGLDQSSSKSSKLPPVMSSQIMKNLNVVSVETFEQEMESLRDQLGSIRNQQMELNDRVKRDMAGIKSILQDIAMVITGGSALEEGVYDLPQESSDATKKKKKKRRGGGDEADGGTTSGRGIVRVAPAPPMQIETYSPEGVSYLPPVTFPDPPSNRSEDA